MTQQPLLIEIGTEELPPKSLKSLAEAFSLNFQSELTKAELGFSQINWYASPRRLALIVADLADKQSDKTIDKRGPAVSAAFDTSGAPTKAAQGWARSNGIEISQAQRLVTDKGEWLLHKTQQPGKTTLELVPEMVTQALKQLPIPRPMRWGSSQIQFIRPVHSVCMLYGEQLVPGTILGVDSNNQILGHRFHSPGWKQISHPDAYLAELEQHYVIADYSKRKEMIRAQVLAEAKNIQGTAQIEESLLEEVTALVEWPVVLSASFEASFLQVPKEALVYTMKGDQKYFPVVDDKGNLKANFIFVSNIQSKAPEHVISGNQKVIRPRLADAEFFFNTDKKNTLYSRLESLDTVLFQKQLGTLKAKSERIATLSEYIAKQIGADAQQAYRAGLLSKTDLMTEMVMEFPDVQGVMGMHYARIDGEDEAVALAQNEQYMPRFSGDSLPTHPVGQAVSLADKLDTLVGIFGIGQLPKGDKDPFALRRAAIGLLRILIEHNLALDLVDLVATARQAYADLLSNDNVAEQVIDFVLSRFKAFYQGSGIDGDVVQSVYARYPTVPADFDARVKGVAEFKSLEAAQALASANKRVANILNKNSSKQTSDWSEALLKEESEVALAKALVETKAKLQPMLKDLDYSAALGQLSELRLVIDNFFDHVMVMDEDETVRANRVALLKDLRDQFLYIADISVLDKQ